MAEQFEFALGATLPPEGAARAAPSEWRLEVAFKLLAMMAGEAVYYVEQIAARANGDEEIQRLANLAIRRLTDEPTRKAVFIMAGNVKLRCALTDIVEMIDNCAGVLREPDSLPMMVLAHARIALETKAWEAEAIEVLREASNG